MLCWRLFRKLQLSGPPLPPPSAPFLALTLRISSTTSGCTIPCTGSPFTWVMRSPAQSPASWAGPPSSTCWGQGTTQTGLTGSVMRKLPKLMCQAPSSSNYSSQFRTKETEAQSGGTGTTDHKSPI